MILSWNVTKACNLKCVHCYRDAGKRAKNELSTVEGKALISEIAKAGFKILIFSGGEPLLRDDIFDWIETAAALGIRPVLGTNGTLLDLKKSSRLLKSGLCRAGISLDAADPVLHDRFRKKKGAWDKAVEAMQNCRTAGLEFQVHTTLARHNLSFIDQITNLACILGARAHHVFFLVKTGRGKDLGKDFLSREEYQQALTRLVRRQPEIGIELKPVCAPQFVPLSKREKIPVRFERGCLAGIRYCCILPDGAVAPCPYLPLIADHVRKTPFSEIWNSNPLFQELRGSRYGGSCGLCMDRDSCSGCRARAYAVSGDFMREDPECFLREHEKRTESEKRD